MGRNERGRDAELNRVARRAAFSDYRRRLIRKWKIMQSGEAKIYELRFHAIEAYGDTVYRLTFRPPNGGDIETCGFPFKYTTEPDSNVTYMVPDARALGALVARLANIPPSAIKQMHMLDWLGAQEVVSGFFDAGKSEETSSNDITISPGSGNGSLVEFSDSPSRS
jgi:hypothetical protein